mmetsp:Transcript_20587/g.37018  ORF Transcript_20587/g.37018 Transcript_20587/m.37018 type:complete len:80 (+) Transcript_20587:91-330(+)
MVTHNSLQTKRYNTLAMTWRGKNGSTFTQVFVCGVITSKCRCKTILAAALTAHKLEARETWVQADEIDQQSVDQGQSED